MEAHVAIFKRKSDNSGSDSGAVEIENEIGALSQRKAKLESRLAAAEHDLEQAVEGRRKHLLEADLDQTAGEPVRDAVNSLRDGRDAVVDAIREIDTKLADAEARLAAEQDRAKRQAAAAELRVDIDALRALVDKLAEIGAQMAGPIDAVAARTPHTTPNLKLAAVATIDGLGLALRQLLADATTHAARLAQGNSEIRPLPVPPPPSPPEPDVEQVQLYVFAKGVRWRAPDGAVRSSCAWSQAAVPTELAEKAIAARVADVFDSPRAVELRASYGIQHSGGHAVEHLVDLDALPAAPEQPSEGAAVASA
jgi:hypothetical protein